MKIRFSALVLWTPVICVISCLIVGPILREGMFVDGLVYTNIARNLDENIGSFWSPQYSAYWSVFYEHPPLLLYLQAVFFGVFGDVGYTEDIYNLVVFTLTLGLMALIWRRALGDDGAGSLVAFPLLFFVLGQEVQLRYPNAMLECGMTLIILLTTLLYLRTVRGKSRVVPLLIVGLGSVLSFLAKGPAGLFPLAMPGIYQLVVNNKLSPPDILLPAVVFGLSLGTLFLIEGDSYNFMVQYFDQQVIAAVRGERTENIAAHRLKFVELLLLANLPAIFLGVTIGWFVRSSERNGDIRNGMFFIVVACSCMFPLVISIKQAAYYQIPAIPFFAIGAALLLKEKLAKLRQSVDAIHRGRSAITGVCLLAGAASVVYAATMINTVDRRDAEIIATVKRLDATLGENEDRYASYQMEVVGAHGWKGEQQRYRMIGYLMRYCDLHPSNREPKYLVKIKTDGSVESDDKSIYQDETIAVSLRE